MKPLKIALLAAGVIALLFCMGGEGGNNHTPERGRFWLQLGLSVSPIYHYERIEDADGNVLSSKSEIRFLSGTTLLIVVSVAAFGLALKLPSSGTKSEHLGEMPES